VSLGRVKEIELTCYDGTRAVTYLPAVPAFVPVLRLSHDPCAGHVTI
jgi:hypothetical protein